MEIIALVALFSLTNFFNNVCSTRSGTFRR